MKSIRFTLRKVTSRGGVLTVEKVEEKLEALGAENISVIDKGDKLIGKADVPSSIKEIDMYGLPFLGDGSILEVVE
jgi:hypothetical protein